MRGGVILLSILASVVAAAPAEARRYVAELPRDGRLVLKVGDGRVTASYSVRLRCSKAPFRRRHSDRRLRGDLDGRRFRISYSLHGDSGHGSGVSETLEITGRLRPGRIVGRFRYEEAAFSVEPGGDERCRFGPRRFRALQE